MSQGSISPVGPVLHLFLFFKHADPDLHLCGPDLPIPPCSQTCSFRPADLRPTLRPAPPPLGVHLCLFFDATESLASVSLFSEFLNSIFSISDGCEPCSHLPIVFLQCSHQSHRFDECSSEWRRSFSDLQSQTCRSFSLSQDPMHLHRWM